MKSFLLTLGQLIFSLLMYAMGTVFFGVSLVPSLALLFKVWSWSSPMQPLLRLLFLGMAVSAGFIIFGLTLILVVGLTRFILGLRLKEGVYSIFSWQAVKWAFLGTLYLLINLTFMDFVLLTPFANLLLRLLGAKLGKNVQINSKLIFDATLVEIGDNTVVGGGAIIIGHIVERSRLKLRKVIIGSNVTIGSHCTVMPGCEIGDNAIIGAGAVLLKNTKVEPRSIYFGVPAENIRHRHAEAEDAQSQS
ncbi:MAG TPA: DapH/DapD/GlmU-related protein [Candidatus Omnitrophota bacterium]|nr:DapH/DapD/GlmU-related protein [Candidatus Omnitrophota bacterium]HRZ14373.1 DapH/DapD/GlmU-related protein [Candidatus Omnitrophota bacterium]